MKEDRVNLRASADEKQTLKKSAKLRGDLSGQNETISSAIIQNAAEYVAQTPNKILIDEHAAESQNFIDQLVRIYVPTLRAVISKIKELGIKEVSKETLLSVIKGDFFEIGIKAVQVSQPDINSFHSPALKSQASQATGEMFNNACMSIRHLLTEDNIDGQPLSDQSFFQYLSFNEDGNPYISETTKAEIIESFKEYLISTDCSWCLFFKFQLMF